MVFRHEVVNVSLPISIAGLSKERIEEINQKIKKTNVFFRKRKTLDLEHTFLLGGVNEKQANEKKREAALLEHKALDAESQRSSERSRGSKNKLDKKKQKKKKKQSMKQSKKKTKKNQKLKKTNKKKKNFERKLAF
jgi:hypothetical protein